MPTISPYDLTTGLLDAVQILSQHMAGKRGGDWGVVGAFKFLEEVNCTVPKNPISEADLVDLTACVERCENIRANPTGATTRRTKKFDQAIARINGYLTAELNLTLDDNVPPNDVLTALVADLPTAIVGAQGEYGALKSKPSWMPDQDYIMAPAPTNADYLDQDCDLTKSATQDTADIAGTKLDAASEYWTPPEPTALLDTTYGPAPPELFQ